MFLSVLFDSILVVTTMVLSLIAWQIQNCSKYSDDTGFMVFVRAERLTTIYVKVISLLAFLFCFVFAAIEYAHSCIGGHKQWEYVESGH
jgi:hypothetical protein